MLPAAAGGLPNVEITTGVGVCRLDRAGLSC